MTKKLQLGVSFALGFFALVIYGLTLAHGVAGGDSGELTVVGYQWGVAHPPGYPLYALFSHLFSLLPWGTVAWRINLFSAFCNALAAACLALTILRARQNVALAVFGASLFCFSPQIWSYSTVAEVFALNNLLIALLLLVSQIYFEKPQTKTAYALFALSGLALTNHQTSLFFIAPLLLWVFWNGRKFFGAPVSPMKAIGFFALGLLPYLYLPLASIHPHPAHWGDQSTFEGFIRHLLRSDYGTFELGKAHAGSGGFFDRLIEYVKHAFTSTWGVGLLTTINGVSFALKKTERRKVYYAWAIAFLFYFIVFNAMANIDLSVGVSREILSRFWQQSDLILCFFAALGLGNLIERYRWAQYQKVLTIGVVLFMALQIGLRFQSEDRSKDSVFAEYAAQMLDHLPPKSILLTQGDHAFGSLRYAQWVDHVRTDITVIDLNYLSFGWSAQWVNRVYPHIHLPFPGYYGRSGFKVADFIHANEGNPIFILGRIPTWDESVDKEYDLWPYGLVERFLPKGTAPAWDEWANLNQQIFQLPYWQTLTAYPDEHWAFAVRYEYAEGRMRFGSRLIEKGMKPGENAKWLLAGIDELEKIPSVYANPQPLYYKNLGVAYMAIVQSSEDARKNMIKNFEKYLEFGPTSDPQVSAIRQTIEKYRTR